MKTSVKEKILHEIKTHGQGWAFSAVDFIRKYNRGDIDVAFATLVETDAIRRVARGIYDYPMYNPILKRRTASDMYQVIQAIARKHNWHIFPDGDTALTYLGLSTQMVAKHIYMSDGPSKTYKINDIPVVFKHLAKKNTITNDKNTMLVIQAISAIGQRQITDKFIYRLSRKFSEKQWCIIRAKAYRSSEWIYNSIKRAADLAISNNKNAFKSV